jgi:prepilin-type N-terminal cleavage/methylation domain-containing protein
MRDESGFSLIELLIAVAIFSILAGIAIPGMLGQSDQARLRGAVNNLRGDLQTAKMMAIRENTFVVVNLFANRYEICVDNGAGAHAGNWACDDDERLLLSQPMEPGVSIDLAATDLTNDRTRFNERGLPENFGKIVLVNSKAGQRQITLNRLGRIALP